MEEAKVYDYKSYLFTIAYDMVGEVQAAEDLVQDSFEKWFSMDRSDIRNPKSYLTKVVINKSIDRLESLKKQRSIYKGLWMPEPIISQEPVEEYTLEYALLFLLEKLNPIERAIFVLRETFAKGYEEIAEFIDTSPDNCRQILHRAKTKIAAPNKKQTVSKERYEELLGAFLLAISKKDFNSLKTIFKEEIVMYQDGGGKMAAALKPIAGFEKIVKFLDAVMNLEPDADFQIQPIKMNGRFGTLVFRNGAVDTVLYLDVDDTKIANLFFLRNPDKIQVY